MSCPDWLSDDLRANPAFVREAIENCDNFHAKAAAAYVAADNTVYRAAISDAVSAWIDHVWQRNHCDADVIFRMWNELEREAKAA